MNNVILERHKPSEYTVNFEGKRYIWAGSKGDKVGSRTVTSDLFDYLSMFTSCFTDGELVIGEKTPNAKELKEDMYGKEEYEANALTKKEVVSLLKGTQKKMETELNKITSDSTKKYVIDVAKEIGLDNYNKQKFLKEWIGYELSIEDLFDM